jgi:hypothetical protein
MIDRGRSFSLAESAPWARLALSVSLALTGACRPAPPSLDTRAVSAELASYAWYEAGTTPAPDGVAAPTWGHAVALSGERALVAHRDDGVRAFDLVNGVLLETGELPLPTPNTHGEYGLALALSPEHALVGVPRSAAQPTGIVQAFHRDTSGWVAGDSLLAADDTVASFGAAVAIDGSLAVVGAPFDQTAYVFGWSGNAWVELATLAPGAFLEPGYNTSRFGAAVAIRGDTVVVGAPGRVGDGATRCGAAYLFERAVEVASGATPTQLLPDDAFCRVFGTSVALSEATVTVGAPGMASAQGLVHVYPAKGGSLLEQLTPSVIGPDDKFGLTLASSGDTLVVGAPRTGRTLEMPGAAYAYEWSGATWVETQVLTAREERVYFGSSVAVDGDTMLVGALDAMGSGVVIVKRRLGAPGAACTVAGDCGSGHCVERVCCDAPCDGECDACGDGTCRPVERGDPGSPRCGSYRCDGTGTDCPDRCRADADCASNFRCVDEGCEPKAGVGEECTGPDDCRGGLCVRRRCVGAAALGDLCERATDCETGYCADGVCCDAACDAQCEACNADGRCRAVTGAPRGGREPCEGAGSTCGGECDGRVVATCSYPGGSVACGSRCEGGNETTSACSGDGECVEGSPRSCAPFECGEAGACKLECRVDGDCAGESVCWSDGTCGPTARCSADGTGVDRPEGNVETCFPFVCGSDGSCLTRCANFRDCASPLVCDGTNCVGLAPPAPASGCSCRGAPRDPSASGTLVLLLLLGSTYARFVRRWWRRSRWVQR